MMRHLPLECIAKVIEFVDNRHDLFNFLTVSKDVFQIAARCLYHDPIKTSPIDHDGSIRKLILFLLSLSPASGKNIDMIRQNNELPPFGTPLYPKPTLDYLSLVKVVCWRELSYAYGYNMLKMAFGAINLDIYRELTWAFVGHRLDEVEELEIELEDKERYLSNAAKMTRMRKIWIRTINFNYKEMPDLAVAMVKAIQLHHGPSQLRECHLFPNPLDHGHNDSYKEIDLNDLWRVVSLLPPRKHYYTLPKPDGSTVSLDHPFDPYVATFNEIRCIDRSDDTFWKVLSELYVGHSQAQILQRFRGLTSLHILSETANGIDENLLSWAACEAEHYHHQPDGHQLGPLVPLEQLYVSFIEYPPFVEPARKVTPKLKILQDGLLGFSSSLKWLRVDYSRSHNRVVDLLVKFTIPRPLLKLKSLILNELTIDRPSWEQVPNIEELILDINFSQLRDRNATSNGSQNDQNTEVTGVAPLSPTLIDTSTTTTTMTTEQQPQQELPEIWFHCPKLTRLRLAIQAVNLLDPTCLHFSPNLQELDLAGWAPITCDLTTDVDVFTRLVPEFQGVLHPTRWTWNWSFPLLSSLTVDGNLHLLRFSLAILHSCPTLKSMFLFHRPTNHRLPLRVQGVLDTLLDKNNNQMLPFVHTKLVKIDIEGNWDIEVDEMVCLLQVLPSLKELYLGSIHFDKNLEDRDLIEITKTHPALVYVATRMKRTTEPPSALGLSKVDSRSPEFEAIARAIESKDDNKIQDKRTRIIYEFKGLDRHALYC